jgi:putative flippase GtrA
MHKLQQLMKFGIVGCGGMIIDFSLTWFFKESLHVNQYPANSIGFTAAVCFNFFANKYWTFNCKEIWLPQFIRYILIAAVGLVLNNLIVLLSFESAGLNFYIAKSIAVVIVFFWNYSANMLFNFKQRSV